MGPGLGSWENDVFQAVWRRFCRAAARAPVLRGVVHQALADLATESWSTALIDDFVEGGYGDRYGVTRAERAEFVRAFRRNVGGIESGTSPLVHLVLAREILSIPPETEGSVVECGVWKGASAASLSLICRRVNRRLFVCDSFQGLPDDGMRRHVGEHTGVHGCYKEGMFAGNQEEVSANIERFGALEVCEFVSGFFGTSLSHMDSPLVCVFLDVDLEQSTRDCLAHLWPLLVDGAAVYTDDAGDLDVVRVFFDDPWWKETLGCPAPGYVGSGCGLPLNPEHSSLGYARKHVAFRPEEWRRAPFLHYPEDDDS